MYAHQVFVLINTATTGISTLSYTTLFRSHLGAPAELVVRLARRSEDGGRVVGHPGNAEHRLIDDGDRPRIDDAGRTLRSEEHTSELQSRQYLVCRLLLEKKNI